MTLDLGSLYPIPDFSSWPRRSNALVLPSFTLLIHHSKMLTSGEEREEDVVASIKRFSVQESTSIAVI